MKKAHLYIAFLFGVVSAALAKSPPELPTVDRVDVQKYLGKWYEVARLPNRFEKKCESDITAQYSLREDGKITVVNACRQKDGKVRTSKGWAKIVDPSNAKLKVTFFWPFFGDYWVIGLDPEYRFAVVSEPERQYAWILSRTPQLAPDLYKQALDILRQRGIDTASLIRPAQTAD